MSSQKIPLRARIESSLSLLQTHRKERVQNAKNVVADHRILMGYLTKYLGLPVEQTRILEIGCGQTAIQTALFHTDGARVTGIDVEVPTFRMGFFLLLQVMRSNGFERALKSLARHLLFDKRYFGEVSKEYGKPIHFEGIDTRIMDATGMAFGERSFDFIFSRSVLEHVEDVESAVKEVNRVLSTEGIAVITVHLFPSLSGGHSAEWGDPDRAPSRRVPPWDHLRDNRFPQNTYLNKLKITDYRHIFYGNTGVLNEQTLRGGEKVLTAELEEELGSKGYTREDLLTSTIIFCIRKRHKS